MRALNQEEQGQRKRKVLQSVIHEYVKTGKPVSSGAIVLGMGELNEQSRPSDLASLQACAAVGQNVLMRTYSSFFHLMKFFDNNRNFIIL